MSDTTLVDRVEAAIRHEQDTQPAYRWRHAAAVAAIDAVHAYDREQAEQRRANAYTPMVANSYRRPEDRRDPR